MGEKLTFWFSAKGESNGTKTAYHTGARAARARGGKAPGRSKGRGGVHRGHRAGGRGRTMGHDTSRGRESAGRGGERPDASRKRAAPATQREPGHRRQDREADS